MNSVHAVLRNWDISQAIINFVKPEDESDWPHWGRSGSKDLVAVALVSRVLSDLALNVLWRDIDLENIIFLFPVDMICVHPRDEKSLTCIPATPQEWERFDVYAPRIHKLSVSRASSNDLFLRGVRMRYPTSYHPFPNLTCLAWSCSPSRIMDAMTLLRPTITEMIFSISCYVGANEYEDEDDDAAAIVLRSLGDICPRLRKLEYEHSSGIRSKSVEASLIYLIRQCRYLEDVELPISPDILRSLGSLPYLSTLRLVDVAWEDGSQLSLPIQTEERIEEADRFPVLDDLTIQGSHTVSSLTECFQGSGCFPRASFSMWEMSDGDEWSTPAIAEFFRGILRPERGQGLLVFRIYRDSEVEDPVGHDPWQALRCLSSIIPNLRTLSLDGLFLDINDADLEEMTRLWPKLRSLTLDVPWQTDDGDDFPSHISFQGLAHLSALQNLETVTLMLAPDSTLPDWTFSHSAYSYSRLNTLKIQGKFPSVSLYPATLFLNIHFPELERIVPSFEWDKQEKARMEDLQIRLRVAKRLTGTMRSIFSVISNPHFSRR